MERSYGGKQSFPVKVVEPSSVRQAGAPDQQLVEGLQGKA